MDEIVSLAKRRGFVYQGSDIYGGLAGTWDYGPLGALLKRNIVNEWLKFFVDGWDDMYQIDSAILMNPKVWQASGHVDTFTDPLVECSNCHGRFREDKIDKSKCPTCGKSDTFGEARQFNMMFKTNVGPVDNEDSIAYLRPETAQGMFTNFKNVVDTFYPDLPFGIAQVGKAFRNEISPRDFIFRTREFEIMEFEYFLHQDMWEVKFEKWRNDMHSWFKHLGLAEDKIKEEEVPENDRAHYSKRTIDFLYDFPSMGFDEIGGLAYRTDFDLKNHQEHSGKNLEYRPKDGSTPFVPHVLEPTFGLDRNFLAVLSQAYTEDEVEGEKRTYLKLPDHLAPVKVAVFPLLKNKPELVAKAKEVHKHLRKEQGGEVMFDDNGNIGKRYRRQDEIGTPHTVTIDFDSLEDDTVTVRNRDTTEQVRHKISELEFEL
ncbi:glycine--tRNA ligase [Candidatus Saccharibacteria bacterium]|nr:glycine--tRNA ligase [Candidatus Saccharibacteria bacterium]